MFCVYVLHACLLRVAGSCFPPSTLPGILWDRFHRLCGLYNCIGGPGVNIHDLQAQPTDKDGILQHLNTMMLQESWRRYPSFEERAEIPSAWSWRNLVSKGRLWLLLKLKRVLQSCLVHEEWLLENIEGAPHQLEGYEVVVFEAVVFEAAMCALYSLLLLVFGTKFRYPA